MISTFIFPLSGEGFLQFEGIRLCFLEKRDKNTDKVTQSLLSVYDIENKLLVTLCVADIPEDSRGAMIPGIFVDDNLSTLPMLKDFCEFTNIEEYYHAVMMNWKTFQNDKLPFVEAALQARDEILQTEAVDTIRNTIKDIITKVDEDLASKEPETTRKQ